MFYKIESIGILKNLITSFPFLEHFNNLLTVLIVNLFIYFCSSITIAYTLSILYNQKINIYRLVIGGLVLTIIYQIPIYLIAFFMPNFSFFHLEDLLTICPPYFILLLYFVSVVILKVNKYRCFSIIQKQYYLKILMTLFYFIFIALGYYLFDDSKDYIFIIFALASLLANLMHIFILLLFAKYIKKNKLWFEGYMQQSDLKISKTLIFNFFKIFPLYILTTYLVIGLFDCPDLLLIIFSISALILIYIFLILLDYSKDLRVFYKTRLIHYNLHIKSLISSINNFRTIKHDLGNMMQVYDGYIKLEDYDSLENYHNKIYNMTKDASDLMEVSKRIEENPALYSILYSKMKLAGEHDVLISVNFGADTKRLEVNPVDLSKIIGILLDNAIEAAAKTENKIIHFTTEYKTMSGSNSDKVLISISNSTLLDINIMQSMESGFTTKDGHKGQGLPDIWNIISKSSSFNLHAEYINNTITFYLELPYINDNAPLSKIESLPILSEK